MASKDRRANSLAIVDAVTKSNPFFEIFGECRLVHRWLESKSDKSVWLLLKLLDGVFRGFSQVVFANNTFSGLFVIIGLGVADISVCAAGLLAATLATVTAWVFNQPWNLISNGLVTYNGVLVGTVTASICPPIVIATNGPAYLSWCLIGFGGIMSALVTSGMANLCKGASLPPMTVPFNLIDLLLFICLPSALTHLAPAVTAQNATMLQLNASTNESVIVLNGTIPDITRLGLDWIMVLRGSLVSMGQVYAAESIACSIIMYLGITMFSPMLSIALFGGSLLASVCALGLTENYGAIYSGLWGYNSALTAGAIAVTFYIPTLLSVFNAAMAIVFTAAAQRAFGLVLAPAGLPILTIPFVVTSSMFLAVTSGTGFERLVKAPDGRPPEHQRRRHKRSAIQSEACDV
ncbi:urea transporter 2-like [Daphnia carinata]|uniref:urea transporter 2-like n=1 Tax=Daphnia carinata TaxID=120202 RepID=UPI00257F5B5C|nr:urea transporter 2-like [Daphnia carinata]